MTTRSPGLRPRGRSSRGSAEPVMASVLPVPLAGACDFCRSSAPAQALLAADAGLLAALGREDSWMAGVGVAPAQVGVQGVSLDGVVAVVGVGDGELPQWPEMGLDRVGPGRVSRGEAQLNPVLPRPAPDRAALVGGQVVQDDVARGAVRAAGRAPSWCCRGARSATASAPPGRSTCAHGQVLPPHPQRSDGRHHTSNRHDHHPDELLAMPGQLIIAGQPLATAFVDAFWQ